MSDTIAIQLTREQQATLNNLRAVIKRQLRPASTVDPVLVSNILLQNSDMMREAGLAREHLDYLKQMRDRTTEKTVMYGRLTTHIAAMKDALDDLRDEAETDHQEALSMLGELGDTEALAEAHIAYGRHLLGVSELNQAAHHYREALTLLRGTTAHLITAVAEGELGRAYVGRGQFQQAIPHFENALKVLPEADYSADERARIQADFATALIQIGNLNQAGQLLKEALEVCDRLGLWSLRGQVRRELAYADQVRGENAQDKLVSESYFLQAEELLKETITDLLPIADTLGLAVAYHDLGRLEARRRNFADAKSHVELSIQMFERLRNRRNLAVAEITLGQIVLLQDGDMAGSNAHLHRALALATQLDDKHTQTNAAQSLLRVHRIQAKRALNETRPIRDQIADQISFTRAKLADIGMAEVAAELATLIDQLDTVSNGSSNGST